MKQILILMLFVGAIISCEKPREIDQRTFNEGIIIDTNSINYSIVHFTPPLNFHGAQINLENDTLIDFTTMSIDLWSEEYDKCLDYCASDTTIICDCWPVWDYSIALKTADNIELLYGKMDDIYPKSFIDHDTIFYKSIWLKKSIHQIVYQNPNGSYSPLRDLQDNFLGYRSISSSDTTYGWIKIWINLGNQYYCIKAISK